MKKNRIITLALSLLIGALAYGQGLIEPAKNYYYNFDNDCAIKAMSAAMDISYKESYILLKDIYVENVGTTTRDLFKIVNREFPNSRIFGVNGLVPSEFIKVFKDTGKYLVVARNHIFYIENSILRGWNITGVNSDYNRQIILAIKLQK